MMIDLKRKREALDPDCSICLEAVAPQGPRSITKLVCHHEFHLDCIGSAFNAKGAMQCPNCRHIETAASSDTTDIMPDTPTCSICLEGWINNGSRSTANLQCGHKFHLDCIISAFNTKGAMHCPICSRVENGRWICKDADTKSREYMEERRRLLRWLASLLMHPNLPSVLAADAQPVRAPARTRRRSRLQPIRTRRTHPQP